MSRCVIFWNSLGLFERLTIVHLAVSAAGYLFVALAVVLRADIGTGAAIALPLLAGGAATGHAFRRERGAHLVGEAGWYMAAACAFASGILYLFLVLAFVIADPDGSGPVGTIEFVQSFAGVTLLNVAVIRLGIAIGTRALPHRH